MDQMCDHVKTSEDDPFAEAPFSADALDLGDFDDFPPLRKGHCNWCGLPLKYGSAQTRLHPGCRKQWQKMMTTVGRRIGENHVWQKFHRSTKPYPERAKKMRNENDRLANIVIATVREARAANADAIEARRPLIEAENKRLRAIAREKALAMRARIEAAAAARDKKDKT